MTKKNLIIVIILLTIIDLVAAGWYMSRRIEASGRSQSLFEQRDSTEVIAMADTVTDARQADEFDKLQHNTYYYIANSPAIDNDNTSYYTSIKHVKLKWPVKVKIVPIYGNVSQVLVYPYMTSQRLLVMEIDKVEYNGSSTLESNPFIHYDRQNQHVLSRPEILVTDFEKESKLRKALNKKIDELNKSRGDNKLQHALNVPAEICCGKKGISFQFKYGTISSSPIEIVLDYDKMEPFLTKDFQQLLKSNEGYSLYNKDIKPEPVNDTPKPAAVVPAKKSKSSPSYNNGYGKKYNNGYKSKRYSKPKRTRRRHYSGATRKSGRYGYAGQRRWKHRRR
mgnify:CR=1 FL=1